MKKMTFILMLLIGACLTGCNEQGGGVKGRSLKLDSAKVRPPTATRPVKPMPRMSSPLSLPRVSSPHSPRVRTLPSANVDIAFDQSDIPREGDLDADEQ